MKKFNALLLLFFILLLTGCKDESSTVIRDKVSLVIQTRTSPAYETEDVYIDKVRFLIFDNQSNALINNYSTGNGTMTVDVDGKFKISLPPNSYSFAIVINETPELTDKLNSIKSLSDIHECKFEWENRALTTKNVPLFNTGKIDVNANGKANIYSAFLPDGARNTLSEMTENIIYMPRAMSQVSVYLRKGDEVKDEVIITEIKLMNIQTNSYLSYTLDEPGLNKSLFTGPAQTIQSTGGGTTHNSKEYHSFSSAIIPEKSFYSVIDGAYSDDNSKAQNQGNAAYLVINATFKGTPATYKVLLRESDLNFRLQRNTNYNIYATINTSGIQGIYAVIEPVEMHNLSINWSPVEGLVIVSDREKDNGKNVNVWSDYTAYSGILKVYKGGKYDDVLFKYGSLIAIKNDAASVVESPFMAPLTPENTQDVLWYPGKFVPTSITNWVTIPFINDDTDFSSKNTPELVALGKGDPCRLAGLTSHQIGEEKIIDNLQWRMATPEEYALLIKAESGLKGNDIGFRSFNELLAPNVKYRDENGVLKSNHNGQGLYWTSKSQKGFSFTSQTLNSRIVEAKTPTQGYAVRCIRVVIDKSNIVIKEPSKVNYQGSANNKYSITSNVPYWKLELVKSGPEMGTATDFEDFSFAPLTSEASTHTIIGGYSKSPLAYLGRWEKRFEDRTFVVRFTSIHYDGTTTEKLFTLLQERYKITGDVTIGDLNSDGWIPEPAKNRVIDINLMPTEVPMPVGAELYVEYYYQGAKRGESSRVITTGERIYAYKVNMDFIKNGTPDPIGLEFRIYMTETGTARQQIGTKLYYQDFE